MNYQTKICTVESVTSGHPDKVCDQISDAVLDACLKEDPKSRVAIETFGGHGLVVVGGELTTNADIDAKKIAQDVYTGIGYNEPLEILTRIVKQSPDISQGVDTGGAGDQGIMYGYATNETNEYLPEGVVLAHKLSRGLEDLRRSGINWLRPDGKSQVTLKDGRVKTVLISTQHTQDVSQEEIKKVLTEKLIRPIIKTEDIEIYVNPTGMFLQGGFEADTGLTGRKLMVDTYGGLIPHGGGCFSGKDATKVDRSAAYMCRFAAKNIVANGLADKCLVSVAYAIGMEKPLMVEAVNEKGESLSEIVNKNFDFRPPAIIERLDLRRPIFQQTASYGHFGKEGLPWEEMVEI
ncbi:methionine adenosyltransferase [Candidatus Falkowbacteria bacterium RIFOXYB2_FULL_34_18]|uniref:Methionine adenosyltransferase n=1 Tax=Candidatus Falkowbacteria bacterium RIFOXYD2_FULL_34_120 TaxID=1798007 RepID=A0A1F5TSM7_9BACT|nr:MAG: methionine adenosyltransferase [Candidatus Falkowbacteria bacterium RIFOXYB2_FULL_34_18]OGF30089.1 MAG: methionine adenosyltransferase [Candidatus Falkowbacteria bacterium RIFOXYC12_FULL_34_55]OGF37577.1 MAG: methionine adenosyltransferase [Candidatus Falkowbacteria bacterium RIFOXYC2_FULL_34_220]OGF39333.1 MAG: methionine adenosyltransferase [Candidatus Falkowbacteria bacterium RIFOXYD12_FULL_34_57]OGF41838.1 MAG: methionine adenosyltransferase [Candidatus Falkowbacteria bacterium RIFO